MDAKKKKKLTIISSVSSQSYFEDRKEMISIENQYFSLTRIILLPIGLWPYQRTKLAQFQLIFILTIFVTLILFLCAAFLSLKCTLDLVLMDVVKILSAISSYNIFITHYVSVALNKENIKKLLIQLQHVHDRLQDRCEKAIMEKYGCIGKRYTAGLIIFGVFSGIIPTAIDLIMLPSGILPINNSQMRQTQYTLKYFVDQEKYITLILIHINVAFCIGLFSLIAGGTLFIVYFQLTCGLLKISSYRIERAISINRIENMSVKNEKVMFKGIICAVDMHREAMRLSELFLSKFEIMLFILILFGVASVSLNLFQISQIGPSMLVSDIKELLFSFIFVVTCVLYMFLSNYTGQNVIDHINNIFVTTYNVQWYRTPIYIQKMILFLLQRRTKSFTLNLKGLIVGSYECFAMLVKVSVSYFAVIYSIK